MKLDILAFGAHPDDVELSCSGTLMKHISLGKKAGIIDLTKGELGTRGTAELRLKEAEAARKIMNITVRENLGLQDGFLGSSKTEIIEVIKKIRKYKPEVVLCNAITDRHPDHGKGAKLISDASFYSGLIKIETEEDGVKQDAWRPKVVYHYIQYYNIKPDFVVDISSFMEKKMLAIKAYGSQFYNPTSNEPETLIAKKDFLGEIEYRSQELGRIIGVKYAEGFTAERYIGVNNLFDLL